jgi:tetratricopeptide (TPR) repeat protein
MSITRAALLLESADGRYRADGFWIVNRDASHIPGAENPRVLATQIEFTSASGTSVCRYTDNPDPEIKDTFTESATLRLYCNGTLIKIFHKQPQQLEVFRHAWRTMQDLGTPEAEAERAQFAAALVAFRNGSAGPEISERVRMHKVVAEGAVRDKRLWEAAEAFEQGLALAPWWPQGNYNLALVYAELRAHALAVRYMQRYLQLVPDAANARAAQDKIYSWQAEADRGARRR